MFGIDRSSNDKHTGGVSAQQESEAVDALRDAAISVGLEVHTQEGIDGRLADLIVINPAGGQLVVEAKRMSLANADVLARRLPLWSQELRERSAVGIVVADRVTREAREQLRNAGWGWLDLRGHLHIFGPGLLIDTELPQFKTPSQRSKPLAGRVAVGVAVRLLLEPDRPVGVRPLAMELGNAPSSVSEAMASLREARLVDDVGRPALPELFWELAARWRTTQADVATRPQPGSGTVNDALRLGLDTEDQSTGWALTDTLAAAAYGAPVSARVDHPPDFYVPDRATLRRALHLLGPTNDHAGRAATVRVAPVPIICSDRVDSTSWTTQEWPLAQPLFVALDLAQDPGRGREILRDWTPRSPWRHVW